MYQQVLDALYRDGDPEILRKSHGQRLAIKMLSFDEFNLELASKLDRYFGRVDKDYIYHMLRRLPFKKTEPRYIKKVEEKKDALSELFKRLARYYGWSMRELEANMQVLQMLAEDKNWLLQMAKFVGLDRKQMKNLGLSVSKPKVKRRKAKTLLDFI